MELWTQLSAFFAGALKWWNEADAPTRLLSVAIVVLTVFTLVVMLPLTYHYQKAQKQLEENKETIKLLELQGERLKLEKQRSEVMLKAYQEDKRIQHLISKVEDKVRKDSTKLKKIDKKLKGISSQTQKELKKLDKMDLDKQNAKLRELIQRLNRGKQPHKREVPDR